MDVPANVLIRIIILWKILTLGLITGPLQASEKQFIIGFAQDTMSNDWRIQQVKDVEQELAKHSKIRFIATDAQGQTAKQILDIETLVKKGIDLLITSPKDAYALTPIVAETYKKGIPVILLDRRINGDLYTTFIGPDNMAIGELAAKRIATRLKGKGRIIMLGGIPTATPTIERSLGFKNGLLAYPGLNIVAEKTANYLRADAIQAMEEIIHSNIQFDAIYSHSDSMATGARMALSQAGIATKNICIIGIDYIEEARQAIRAGEQDSSFTYPTGGKEGAVFALRILNGMPVPKHIPIASIMVEKSNVDKVKPIF
ncbi:MAG: substrate-binding domain-containing protein [Gammaproteobacteria bacterium]|nr:substrate-binding domain-containing protein [Gammaproteobacteria bacterium]MDH5800674.1 substrate-binding domain-containing protein [Gammaproteobacteria bacterium]